MSKKSVIEYAEDRLQDEERQHDLGADNGHDLAYWAAYLDGAWEQKKEDQKDPHGPMRDLMIDQQIDERQRREELTAQIADKDYLIQQQTEEIERLRRDVKKQQEKMFELAKRLPKQGEWKKGVHSVTCSVCGSDYEFADNVFVEDYDMDKDLDMRYCPKCGRDNCVKMEVRE